MFFFNDTATTEIYTLSLHDALPILTQPGLLLVCGDSHTSTHGALGALAFGIGSTEVAHVLATQTLWQRKPKTMRITVEDRKSTRLNSSHANISYAVFCLKKNNV